MSENKVKLGELITEPQERDAIHVAVAPVVAGEKLAPGQDIGILEDGRGGGNARKLIGIVDPFLKRLVQPDQEFWMFLYPNTITSLRHDWTHPAFAKVDAPERDTSASEKWLKDFADQWDLTYEELMNAGHAYIDHGDYLNRGGRFEGESVPDEFWDHFTAVTGKVTQNRGSFFTCAC